MVIVRKYNVVENVIFLFHHSEATTVSVWVDLSIFLPLLLSTVG